MTIRLEWWPDYNAGPLWTQEPRDVDLGQLGVSAELLAHVETWIADYQDARLPIDGDGDAAWLQEGIHLLSEVRQALGPGYEVVATEPWWGEEPIS